MVAAAPLPKRKPVTHFSPSFSECKTDASSSVTAPTASGLSYSAYLE